MVVVCGVELSVWLSSLLIIVNCVSLVFDDMGICNALLGIRTEIHELFVGVWIDFMFLLVKEASKDFYYEGDLSLLSYGSEYFMLNDDNPR